MTEEKITLVLADDHAVVRVGLRMVLEAEDDIEVLAEAADAEEALSQVREHRPAILLLDVTMPGRPAIEAIPDLLEACDGTRVLVLSMQSDPAFVRNALRAGASGYVLKGAADSEVVEAVRQVAAGSTYLQPELGAQLAREPEPAAAAAPGNLSEREAEVLGLLALGHTNQEIAQKLYLSVRTVESHRAHIQQKLGISSRAELVRYAFDHGLVDR